uniref:Uncharacterized protein n=1 Tax=Oryza sativa subsp. japonica TaxID=39947 RepID=Q8GVX6_ORYSJ|nr:hypothetical protein [Oryza sativa Japonica Group]
MQEARTRQRIKRTAAAAYVQWPAREQTPTAGAGGGDVPARPTGSEHRRLERAAEAAWSARGNCDSAAVDFVDFLSVNLARLGYNWGIERKFATRGGDNAGSDKRRDEGLGLEV